MDQLRKLAFHLGDAGGSRYALFLGAGASVESGGRTGNEIMLDMLRRLYGIRTEDDLQQQFARDFGRPATFENVIELLGSGTSERRDMLLPSFKNMVPSEGYIYLAALIKANRFYPVVLTTNFDQMLETALHNDTFIDRSVRVRTLVQEEIPDNLDEPEADEIVVVKLHGDIDKPETLRMTTSQTAGLSKSAEQLIIRLCEDHGLVVVGYRAKDIGVRNALERSSPTANGIFWISRNKPQDPEVQFLLEKHRSQENVIHGNSFDMLFHVLGTRVVTSQARTKHKEVLSEAWDVLNRARSQGRGRRDVLVELHTRMGLISKETHLNELLALEELIQYELDPSAEIYRIEQGVQFLMSALEEYSGDLDEQELARLEYTLLRELLHFALKGNAAPEGRLAELDKLIERGNALFKRLHTDATLLPIRCQLILAETFKERAMVHPGEYKSSYEQARAYCEEVRERLRSVTGNEARLLLGLAYRYEAVTYELEGDLYRDAEKRRELFDKWHDYSEQAMGILSDLAEDRELAYAMMNVASSYTHLIEFEVRKLKQREMLEAGISYLTKAIDLLKGVSDFRGVGWAYCHLCEATRFLIDLTSSDRDRRRALIADLEIYANKAVASLRQIEDPLALGWAYEQLGVALLNVFKESGATAQLKLERATTALNEAVKRLEKTGYYRGAGEALFWLATAQHLSGARETAFSGSREQHLLQAIQSSTRGIAATAAGFRAPEELEQIYDYLISKLGSILKSR